MVLVIEVVANDGRPGQCPFPSSSEPLLASEIAIETADVDVAEVDEEEEVTGGRITAVLEVDSAAAELLCVSTALDSGLTEDEGDAPEPQSPNPAWHPTPQCSTALPHHPRELEHTCQRAIHLPKARFQSSHTRNRSLRSKPCRTRNRKSRRTRWSAQRWGQRERLEGGA
jgi:hypothetical protein